MFEIIASVRLLGWPVAVGQERDCLILFVSSIKPFLDLGRSFGCNIN